MKRNSTLGLAIAAFALVLSACSSNLTVAKRQYNKGWNISLGGGKAGQFERPTRLERVAQAEVQPEVAPMQEPMALSEENAAVLVASVASTAQAPSVAAKSAPTTAQKAVTKAAAKAVEKVQAAQSAPSEKKGSASTSGSGHSQWIALALVLLLPGIHRFYLGYYLEGVLFILTAGGCGIWWIIDLVRILTGDLGPADGSGYTEEI
jgi:TM2 domain-containing membrane protein YozV